jgi:hypothetical protein
MVTTIAELYGIRNLCVMAINWDRVVARLSMRGPDGRLLSAITGEETEAELRVLAMRLAHGCPYRQQHPGCPFCSLRHLYHRSLQSLLDSVSQKALMGLFELEWEVRISAAAAAPPPAGGNFAAQADAAG